MRKAKPLLIIGVLGFLFSLFEVLLRTIWGFGGMVLFKEDKNFEYIANPNQDRERFGNRIFYNEYSMRSFPLDQNDKCVVLGFGDSVINGGTLTDQDSLATTLVEKQLGDGFRFLNISAGSWGPDNCAQYLKEHGAFNAKMIVLFVSSHDAHDNMTFEKTVGVHESYPDKQYPLASLELIDRYIIPRIASYLGRDGGAQDLMINKNGEGFNPGFDFFREFTQVNNIPFVVCLHAERQEIEDGKFNAQGQEILTYCNNNNIKVISGLEIGEEASEFRDHIHINEKGQKRWAKILLQEIKASVNACF